ncbi:MAG: NAD(P)/FAD-dependent oxidoreductase [Chloroflexales bacterium]|nr:NAD(P)/FAD-dependent oxidoreductase [Chloroflexales bacterium]
MHDLIIIGGGPASQSAAMYAIGKQINFLMIYEKLGGRVDQVTPADRDYLVGSIVVHFDFPDAEDEEDHLIGSSAVHLFERQIKTRTGRVLNDLVTQIKREGDVFHVATKHHGVQQGVTVLLATGAKPRSLEVPGAGELLVGNLGYSVTTHSQQIANRSVGVVGTTEYALYGAAEFAQTAAQVYLVIPDTKIMSLPIAQALTQRPNVEVLAGYRLTEVVGRFKVEQLVVERAGQPRSLNVDVAYVDVGREPQSDLVKNFGITDQDGFVQTNGSGATDISGLFAAGDVTRALGEQVLIAIGDGARAAVSAHQYLLTQSAPRQLGT